MSELISEPIEASVLATSTLYEETNVLGMFGIQPALFGAQLLNFLIVVLVLWKWVFTPIVKRLDERTGLIEKGLLDATHAQERLAKIDGERSTLLAQATKEAQALLVQASALASVQAKEVEARTKREIERLILQGKEQLTVEREAMVRSARKEMVEIIVAGAKKLVATSLDEKKSVSLAEEVVRKLT